MGFRDNLKLELSYKGMLVKELAHASGVKKRALDTYLLSENPSMPPADVAVRIAKALGVSVEYLVNGSKPAKHSSIIVQFSPKIRDMALIAEKLKPDHQKVVLAVTKTLKRLEESHSSRALD